MMTVLECHGAGARKFLQGQLTCDLDALLPDAPQLTACCNIQGRVIFIADLAMKSDEFFLLQIPSSMSKIVINHLEKYARFSKCALTENHQILSFSQYDKARRISQGLPNIYPETSEQFMPQRLNLHLIPGAMSFKKGCYLGQEIISRLHFKGTLKHHLYSGQIQKKIPLRIGEPINSINGENTGSLIDYCEDLDKLALIFVNEIENKAPHLCYNAIKEITLPTYS